MATVLLSAACMSAPTSAAATGTTESVGGDLPSPQRRISAAGDGDMRLPEPSRTLAGTASQTMAWPARGRLTSGFGRRWGRMHRGIDVAAPVGTPIRAAQDGRVSFVGWKGGYGLTVEIRHGRRQRTRYAHQSEVTVTRGARVRRGQHIGRIGMTGATTGPHLHFELAGVERDPEHALPRRG